MLNFYKIPLLGYGVIIDIFLILTVIMRLIFIFTVLVSLASCEEARKQEAQKAADEIRYETAQKRHETNMKMIQRRSEIEIAMIEAGSPKDSIKSVIDSMYIRDSIYLNEHFDTTRYIIK